MRETSSLRQPWSSLAGFLWKPAKKLVSYCERHHARSFRHIRNTLLEIHSRQKEHTPFEKEMLLLGKGPVLTLEQLRFIEGAQGIKDTYKTLFQTDTILEFSSAMSAFLENGQRQAEIPAEAQRGFFHILRNRKIKPQIELLLLALQEKLALYFVETGFVSCVTNVNDPRTPIEMRRNYSYMVDDRGFYYDALLPTRIEQYLNSEASRLDNAEKARARELINILRKNKISKYNYQPDVLPQNLQNTRPKVLVVDQSRMDASVTRGLADENTFAAMLEAAKRENPDADILIKTHPDSINRGRGSYYARERSGGRIHKIGESTNPFTLLEAVDKVYVCTSMMGLEALFCGKETHVFGMPVYAGWGLTQDRQTLERRKRKLTLEELVFALYFRFTVYISPETGKFCEAEVFLTVLLGLCRKYKQSNQKE